MSRPRRYPLGPTTTLADWLGSLDDTAVANGSAARANEERVVREARWLAAEIVPQYRADCDAGAWSRRESEFLAAFLLHLAYTRSINLTLADVAAIAREENAFDNLHAAVHDLHGTYGWIRGDGLPTRTHPTIRAIAIDQLCRPSTERGAITAGILAHLARFESPDGAVRAVSR